MRPQPNQEEIIRAAWYLRELDIETRERWRDEVLELAAVYADGRAASAKGPVGELRRLAEERARIEQQFATLRDRERAAGLY